MLHRPATPTSEAATIIAAMYLVDTNVLSAGAPARDGAHVAVATWMDVNSDRLFLSTITVAEVADGITKARRDGASRKAERLSEWLDAVLHLYATRVLAFDVPAARATGVLVDHARARGHVVGFADLAIAGTARARGLTVLTRNVRHFGPLGVPAENPYEMLS